MRKCSYLTAILLCWIPIITFALSTPESATASYLEAIRTAPEKLSAFLQAMPKGGDLHNHASGASYAENMLRYASKDSLCVNPQNYIVRVDANCVSEHLLSQALIMPEFYDHLIDEWSMRNFHSTAESGREHFFAAFKKFGVISTMHRGEIFAEVTERAARDNTAYVELMTHPDGHDAAMLGKELGWDADFDLMWNKVRAHKDFETILNKISSVLSQDEAKKRSVLACDTVHPKKGCHVVVRYLYEAQREQAPEMVFAQILIGLEATRRDKRIVGLNLVQPEDGPLSMKDYRLHMQIIGYLHQRYPDTLISLHAGELSEAVAPKEGLRFHIHDAVNVAHANRIGHGADITEEDDAVALLQQMVEKNILVEINLSSNALILNIDEKVHPLPLYLRYGVPIAFSTDDPGVLRSHLTKEFEQAVAVYHLDYMTLKTAVRNSLTYSFLPGATLWASHTYQQVAESCEYDVLGAEPVSLNCQNFLKTNEKAALQWDLERQLIQFEAQYQ